MVHTTEMRGGGINIFQVWKSRKRILLSNFGADYKLLRGGREIEERM